MRARSSRDAVRSILRIIRLSIASNFEIRRVLGCRSPDGDLAPPKGNRRGRRLLPPRLPGDEPLPVASIPGSPGHALTAAG